MVNVILFEQYGGNPVACSIGIAVCEVIQNEKLLSSAKMVGKFMMEQFRRLMRQHLTIGDVRGMGLILGIEIVRGRPNISPAAELAGVIVNRFVEH